MAQSFGGPVCYLDALGALDAGATLPVVLVQPAMNFIRLKPNDPAQLGAWGAHRKNGAHSPDADTKVSGHSA